MSGVKVTKGGVFFEVYCFVQFWLLELDGFYIIDF